MKMDHEFAKMERVVEHLINEKVDALENATAAEVANTDSGKAVLLN